MFKSDELVKRNKKELEEIIIKFEEEINKNDFETIYKKIDKYIASIFTALLLKNNINPLEYIDFVPEHFASTLDIKKFIIPDNITSIGDDAFYYCTSLSEIEIPDSVTSIGSSAFSYCESLSEIEIPNNVTSIGAGAFGSCTSLSSIVIPDGVTSIDSATFSCCTSLSSVVIPDGVTSIGNYAFSNCTSLTEIIIPSNVKSIGYNAFAYCLKDVYYKGSEEDWKNIKIEPSNWDLFNATIHYNS